VITIIVSLKAVAGQLRQSIEVTAAGNRQWSDVKGTEPVFCACESDQSAVLTVRCPGAPSRPQLRVEKMDESGVEVAWETPSETADDDDVTVCCTVYVSTTLVVVLRHYSC